MNGRTPLAVRGRNPLPYKNRKDVVSDRSTPEVNFDGLVGPTHNYAGLSMATWRPKATPLRKRPTEGGGYRLRKMKRADRARHDARCWHRGNGRISPPAAAFGFTGNDASVLAQGRAKQAPPLPGRPVTPPSSMWTRQRRHRLLRAPTPPRMAASISPPPT